MAIHGLPQDAKILSHYLENSRRDPYSIYELKRDSREIAARGENLIKIQIARLPRSGPFHLHRGPQIIEAAYRSAFMELSRLTRVVSAT